MSEYLQIQTTTANQQQAETIAQAIVERRLAACVQVVGPIKSFYRWQDKLETSQEWLCLVKTAAARFGDVEHAIRELHPYEVPEIIAVPITQGSNDYLTWLKEQV